MPPGKKGNKITKIPTKSATKRCAKVEDRNVVGNESKQKEKDQKAANSSTPKKVKEPKKRSNKNAGGNDEEDEQITDREAGEMFDCVDLDMGVSTDPFQAEEENGNLEENQVENAQASDEEDREIDDQNNNATRDISPMETQERNDFEMNRTQRVQQVQGRCHGDRTTSSRASGEKRKQSRYEGETEEDEQIEEEQPDEQTQFLNKLINLLEKREEQREAKYRKQCQGGGDRESPLPKRKRIGNEPNLDEGFHFNKQKRQRDGPERQRKQGKENSCDSKSETTIYKPMVELILDRNREDMTELRLNNQSEVGLRKVGKRGSSSSEDFIDTSREMERQNNGDDNSIHDDNNSDNEVIINKFITDMRRSLDNHDTEDEMPEPQPHSSRQLGRNEVIPTPEDRSAEIIRKTKRSKARILTVPGENFQLKKVQDIESNKEILHSVLIDEGYSAVSGHVDEITRKKVIAFEYVDFAKLLPHDNVAEEDEEVMQLVNRRGVQAWAPMKEKDNIFSFSKWEQAFRVFCNILTEAYPQKSAELIQYNHVINTAAQSFVWDNVYKYDKDFRRHISKFPA